MILAELTKIWTQPAAWIALGAAIALDTALGALARSGGALSIGTDWSLAAALPFLAIAVFAAGDEYRGGQLRVSLAAMPHRRRFVAAKLTATVIATGAAAAVAVLPGSLLRADGVVAPRIAAYVLLSLVGFGFAVLTRSVVTPLVVLIVVPVLVSPMLPWPTRFLPYEAAVSVAGGEGSLIAAGWAAVCVVAASSALARRRS